MKFLQYLAHTAAIRCIQLYLVTFTISLCADDTEIFFGGSSSAAGAIAPNVLFVLDTSSSMNNTDGLGETRLDRMKEALRDILTDSNNINVGLMRFSNPGGPVLYPVSPIDGILESADAELGTVAVRINSGDDDVEQSGIDGTMSLNNNTLTMVEVESGVSTPIAISVAISSDIDDVEQSSDGSLYTNSSDLELAKDGGDTQIVGLRFQMLNIPQGAIINSADIEFVIDEVKNANKDIDIGITGHATDNAEAFNDSITNAVSSRTRTTANITWENNTASPAIGEKLYSTDISAIIQEIVDRPGWTNNNSLALILEKINGNGVRTVESSESGLSTAPTLRVTFTDPGAGPLSTDFQFIGLRFNGVEIPQGATVTSANIQFAAATAGFDFSFLVFFGQDADNSPPYTGTDFDVTSRPFTTALSIWSPVPAYTVEDEAHITPSLSDIVQEIVNRPDWCGGNSLSFLIVGFGKRIAKSYEADPSQAPYLQVTFDPDTIPASPGGCLNAEISARVKSGNDDAEESASGTMSLNSSDLELVQEGSTQKVGMRFRSLPLQQGSTILSAHLELVTDETGSGSTSLTIEGHDIDDSAAFTTTDNDISDRTRTTASATWSSVPAWNVLQEKQQSIDIANVIQEIVDRPGWLPGNDLSLLISGSGKRVAESYDGSPGEAPRLVIRAQGTGAVVADKTVRTRLIEIVDELQYKSGTPIVDSLYEAALYYRGDPVDYGANRGASDTSRREHTRVSHANALSAGTISQPVGCSNDNLSAQACREESISGGVYESPIDTTLGSCQQNYVVLLTDGSPSVNQSVDKVKTMANISTCQSSGSAACGEELAKYLFEEDQIPGGDSQTVTTFTIGFNFTDDYIRDIASNGGGSFFEANTATELSDTFSSIIKEILKTDTTFVAPGATVNQFNRLTHRNELYFSLFKPDDDPRWTGNLKRYQLFGDPAQISDQNELPAIDTATGFFKTSARSFWSTGIDGKKVSLGGAAENLPAAASRHVYTYINSTGNKILSHSDNAFNTTNAAVSKTLLGIEDESDDYRTDLINWARGVDIFDADGDGSSIDRRKAIGDPLHSKPTLVTFGGTEANPDNILFFSTNEGYLHAIDSATGVEIFSFIPQDLLVNIDTFFENSGADSHPYGLDGSVVPWVIDNDGDNQIEAADGDRVVIYFGMRRGGKNYYALDVTDRNNPELLWVLKGGINGSDFEQLGQTWSTPVKAKVIIAGNLEEVLIFAGGYDETQDSTTVQTVDSHGNAIFIVRAGADSLSNGGDNDFVPDLLWSAGNANSFTEKLTDMNYSMPSPVKVIDINADGLPDQMYVGDQGGQIFRFDFDHTNTQVNAFISGGLIASINGGDAANNRRFYNAPDLSLINIEGAQVLNVSIGSGYRAHPLDETVNDRFYSFRQTDVFTPPGTYTTIVEADLYDATANLLGTNGSSLSSIELTTELDEFAIASGWFIDLEGTGEKVLAKSLTINNQVLFTTYEPNNSSTTGCVAAIGTSRVYAVSVFDATPIVDNDDDDVLSKSDRSVTLATGSIAPEPIALIPDGVDPLILIGPETPISGLNFGDLTVRTYWYQNYEVLPD
ncbi:MAG: VWA domain-containing protein [Pseudomonadales bacterium]|nr:VWA domain-containing protein [Pseudomonadales bacterium]